jgi:hypothetical protein
MVVEINVLCPDLNESPSPEVKPQREEERSIDRSRVTRLQVINIYGEIVDIEN